MSSSLLLLPSNLQFRCMNYLVLFAIYKIFLYPLGNNEKFSVLFLVMNIFFQESLFWRFFFACIRFSFWMFDLHRMLVPTATIRGYKRIFTDLASNSDQPYSTGFG